MQPDEQAQNGPETKRLQATRPPEGSGEAMREVAALATGYHDETHVHGDQHLYDHFRGRIRSRAEVQTNAHDRPRNLTDERRIAELACGTVAGPIRALAEERANGCAEDVHISREIPDMVRGGRDLLAEAQDEAADQHNYVVWRIQELEAAGHHEHVATLRLALLHQAMAFKLVEDVRHLVEIDEGVREGAR